MLYNISIQDVIMLGGFMINIENNIYNIEVDDIKNLFKERPKDSHKGMFGTIGIMGGSIEYSGSVKLANMSAVSVRSGCGIVRVIVPEVLVSAIMPYLLEQTLYSLKDNNGKISYEEINKALNNLKALAIGMGWGVNKENQEILNYLITNYQGPILIDADGLNNLAQMDLNILLKAKNKIILTPHLKEFERLTNISIDKIKHNSLKIAKEFAKKYNVILLLKGTTTIITDGNLIYLSSKGCPGMATAGSGDVLSGIIIGMLGYHEANILTIASATYLAGLAGEFAQVKYTDIAMKASDTIEFIPEAIKYIRNKN